MFNKVERTNVNVMLMLVAKKKGQQFILEAKKKAEAKNSPGYVGGKYEGWFMLEANNKAVMLEANNEAVDVGGKYEGWFMLEAKM